MDTHSEKKNIGGEYGRRWENKRKNPVTNKLFCYYFRGDLKNIKSLRRICIYATVYLFKSNTDYVQWTLAAAQQKTAIFYAASFVRRHQNASHVFVFVKVEIVSLHK